MVPSRVNSPGFMVSTRLVPRASGLPGHSAEAGTDKPATVQTNIATMKRIDVSHSSITHILASSRVRCVGLWSNIKGLREGYRRTVHRMIPFYCLWPVAFFSVADLFRGGSHAAWTSSKDLRESGHSGFIV